MARDLIILAVEAASEVTTTTITMVGKNQRREILGVIILMVVSTMVIADSITTAIVATTSTAKITIIIEVNGMSVRLCKWSNAMHTAKMLKADDCLLAIWRLRRSGSI